jgi:hypothetical protein
MRLVIFTVPLCLASFLAFGPRPSGKQAGAEQHITIDGVGYGQTEDEAITSARDYAVTKFMNEHGDLWQGAEEYVQKHATVAKRDAQRRMGPDADPPYKATLTLDLDSAACRELIERDRNARAAERHGTILPAFAIAVLLLGGIGVYYRMSSAARGR